MARAAKWPKRRSVLRSACGKQIGVPVKWWMKGSPVGKLSDCLEEVQGRFIHEEKLTGGKKPKSVQAKMTVDAVAAAVILKEYLDRQEQTAGKT